MINPSKVFEVEEDTTAWNLFYPAPTYAERQAEWLKENNVKIGTKVRVTRGFKSNESGSSCGFGTNEEESKANIIGQIGKVIDLTIKNSIALEFNNKEEWCVPFTVLEIVKEPTYRPYNDDELNNLVGKTVVFTRDGNKMLVIERISPMKVRLGYGRIYTAEQLLEWFTLDGEPCGIKEEV